MQPPDCDEEPGRNPNSADNLLNSAAMIEARSDGEINEKTGAVQ
jgi:hypothetical protein